jgi:hypothetical protein
VAEENIQEKEEKEENLKKVAEENTQEGYADAKLT